MKRSTQFWFLLALAVCIFAPANFLTAATPYLITNDDPGVSFFTVAPDGTLSLQQQVGIGGFGTVAGFFGANRVVALNSGKQQCVYASSSSAGSISGIVLSSLLVGGTATGSSTDSGASNGIGLAVNGTYLYASFVDSNTIGTFQLTSGCGLTFLNDLSVAGLAGGMINGMAIHGNIMVTTYTDGSIHSFDISAGTPISNGDEQYSTATLTSQDATYPNSVDITSDGHFAIFGDTSTSQVIEVSDISSAKLTKPVVYKSKASISWMKRCSTSSTPKAPRSARSTSIRPRANFHPAALPTASPENRRTGRIWPEWD
jgi:hypothetical protein